MPNKTRHKHNLNPLQVVKHGTIGESSEPKVVETASRALLWQGGEGGDVGVLGHGGCNDSRLDNELINIPRLILLKKSLADHFGENVVVSFCCAIVCHLWNRKITDTRSKLDKAESVLLRLADKSVSRIFCEQGDGIKVQFMLRLNPRWILF